MNLLLGDRALKTVMTGVFGIAVPTGIALHRKPKECIGEKRFAALLCGGEGLDEFCTSHSSWWKYLEHSYAYMVEDNALVLTDHFFDECAEGQIRFVIDRYAVSLGKDVTGGSLAGFSDADQVGAGQKNAVSWAVGQRIVNGTPEGTLEPGRNVSRAEAAAMVMRFCKSI